MSFCSIFNLEHLHQNMFRFSSDVSCIRCCAYVKIADKLNKLQKISTSKTLCYNLGASCLYAKTNFSSCRKLAHALAKSVYVEVWMRMCDEHICSPQCAVLCFFVLKHVCIAVYFFPFPFERYLASSWVRGADRWLQGHLHSNLWSSLDTQMHFRGMSVSFFSYIAQTHFYSLHAVFLPFPPKSYFYVVKILFFSPSVQNNLAY